MRNRWIVAGVVAVALAIVVFAVTRSDDDEPVAEPGCGGEPAGPGAFIGVDRLTGERIWSVTVGSPTGAAESEGMLVVGSSTGVVRAFDDASGDARWCLELAAPTGERLGDVAGAGPVVAAFAAADLVGFDIVTGEELWRRTIDEPEAWLATDGANVWLGDAGAAPSGFVVLDPLTGLQVSPTRTPPTPGFSYGPPPVRIGSHELEAETMLGPRQELRVAVTDGRAPAWEATVPGFVAALADSVDGPVVLILDQTGGTGEIPIAGADTRLTAYAVANGERVWQVSLPGTPHVIAPLGSDLVVVPVDTAMHAIDPATGETHWVTDHGSPGSDDRFSVDGGYRFVTEASDGSVVGLVVAEEPYRD